MRVSTRTRYGLRAMLELALEHNKGPLQINVIAQRQAISDKYLEQLIAVMRSAGLVRSMRGPKGGYCLTKAPSAITIYDIFSVLEGPFYAAECLEDKSYCDRYADCVAREVWTDVQQAVKTVLQSVTLQDMVDKVYTEKKQSINYQI